MSTSMSGGPRRVALFVDGDNLAPSFAHPILTAAGQHGVVDVRRVYAAEAGFRAWAGTPGFRPVQVGGAKNGTDLLLCIEAVEMVCSGRLQAVVLASDDRDFSHLAHWLRERGVFVLGLGTAKSPLGWRAACSEFAVLEAAFAPAPAPVMGAAGAKKLSDLDICIRHLIRGEGEGGAISLGLLGARMGSVHRMTLERVGVADWRSYLLQRPDLYDLDPKGVASQVRWIGPCPKPR